MSKHDFAVGDIVYTWQYAWTYGVRKVIIRTVGSYMVICEALSHTGPFAPRKDQHISFSMAHKSFAVAERRAKKLIATKRLKAEQSKVQLTNFINQCDTAEKSLGDMIV